MNLVHSSKPHNLEPSMLHKWICFEGKNRFQTRVWHSYGFWYERISEYIRVKKMIRTNIRIYSYEHFWHERISEYIRIKISIRTNIRINIRIKNIWIFEFIFDPNIYSGIRSYHFLDTNIFRYSFVSTFCFCLISLDITLRLCIFRW